MSGSDIFTGKIRMGLHDVRVAFALLTRLPLPFPPHDENRPAAAAAWAYPLVGIAVAGFSILALSFLSTLGLPLTLGAIIALLIGVLCTGAMHEDGLADCADGFWGGWTQERRLEIMKDSQIGTYGVLALILAYGAKWQALIHLAQADALGTLILAAVLARGAMVCVMYALPNARASGLSKHTGRPNRTAVFMALIIGVVTCLIIAPQLMLATGIVMAVGIWGLSNLAQNKIGGQTGDVLGAVQQVIEILILLTCVVLT